MQAGRREEGRAAQEPSGTLLQRHGPSHTPLYPHPKQPPPGSFPRLHLSAHVAHPLTWSCEGLTAVPPTQVRNSASQELKAPGVGVGGMPRPCLSL